MTDTRPIPAQTIRGRLAGAALIAVLAGASVAPVASADVDPVARGMAAAAMGNISPVPSPSGTAVGDTAAINAAFAKAGNGGTVRFPAGKTYLVGERCAGWPGSASGAVPALVDLNGSTIKLNPTVVKSTTTATATTGTTSVPVATGHGADFCAGDWVLLRDVYANKIYSYPAKVTAVSSDTLAVTAISMASGITVPSGGVIERVDAPLYIAAGGLPVRVTSGTVDGNLSNRSTQSQVWSYGDLLVVQGASRANVDHMHFLNGAVSGLGLDDSSYTAVTESHFENLAGIGLWPGGAGTQVDFIVAGNTFKNVFQFTGATTPTADQFGHTSSQGAIASSNGSLRTVIANNTVDTSTGYCISTIQSPYSYEYAITGNALKSCDMGAWQVRADGLATITGNFAMNSGHDTPYVPGAKETTQINTSGDAEVVVSSNVFFDTVLNVVNDSKKVAITGNYFSNPDLTNVTRNTNVNIVAALGLFNATTFSGSATIAGNTFVGPSGAVTNSLDLLRLSAAKHVAVTGNNFTGGWIGLSILSAATDITIFGNDFVDQSNSNSGAQNAAAILSGNIALTNVQIAHNNMTLETSGTAAWSGINLAAATYTNASVTDNGIHENGVTPASGSQGIVFTGTGAGLTLDSNRITMNSAGRNAIAASSASAALTLRDNTLNPAGVAFNIGSAAFQAVPLKPDTFANYPTCAAAYKGLKGTITDSSTSTFGATIAGAGGNIEPTTCNGTNWIVGQLAPANDNLPAGTVKLAKLGLSSPK